MGKRKADSDEESPHRKREKFTQDQNPKTQLPNIHSSKDLQLLLAFEQDAGPHTRQKIRFFKLLLESIAYGKESVERSAKRQLLLDYLQSQAPREDDETALYLIDLIKTWHYAAQSNVESIFSSTVAVLALLLRTISSLIDFRACGNRLCRSLLHDDQLQLFDRAFTANKAKEHLISPCLTLLTEIVLFDGGHSARSVFRQRETTFKRLEVFLGMRKNARDGDSEKHKRPSIRNNALRYLYANLRLQNSVAKMSILAQGKFIRAMFEHITDDASEVILEMLDVIKNDVASDGAITHSAKGSVFSTWTLGRLATLYSYTEADDLLQKSRSVQETAHAFLLVLCTTPGWGVLENQNEVRASVRFAKADLGDEQKRYSSTQDFSHNRKRFHNTNERLALFLQSLRPHASVLQSDLIIAVFRNRPELVADYFTRRNSFSFDPKATATWIGYSSFLLATVQLPLPEPLIPKENRKITPSQHNIVMDNILPQPLTQKVLTRCLNQSTYLVKFLSIRILIAAFEKFAKFFRMFHDVSSHSSTGYLSSEWDKVASKLRVEFFERLPEMEHVVAQFRNCPNENAVLRESITRLLALYFKVIPEVALEETLDVSVALSAALTDQATTGLIVEGDSVRILEMGHLLAIAHDSPNTQWFHKSGGMRLSPFTMLLRLYLGRRRNHLDSEDLELILKSIVADSQILHSPNSLHILVLSLRDTDQWKASNRVFEFIDDCILRLARKPIRYHDGLANLVKAAEIEMNVSDSKIDLLLVATSEQWPFLVNKADPLALAIISTWLVRYVELMRISVGRNSSGHDGGDSKIISLIRDQMKAKINDNICKRIFSKGLQHDMDIGILIDLDTSTIANGGGIAAKTITDDEGPGRKPLTNFLPRGPPKESEDHPGLNNWSREDVQDAISGGSIADLILCLCSEHTEIRKQALGNMCALVGKLESSGYDEWQRVFMLAGELVETTRTMIDETPLPYFAGALAAQLLSVITDPLHVMYGKVNKFLNRGPSWTVTKLPSYWVDKIMLNPPTDDDAHYQEIEWLLDALSDGLRTPADFHIYRRCGIFERLLTFITSPSLPEICSQKTVDLLFRCTYIEGSTTLITRCGLLSWVSSCLTMQKLSGTTGDRLRILASRAYETSDQDHVNEWSNETVNVVVDSPLIPSNE